MATNSLSVIGQKSVGHGDNLVSIDIALWTTHTHTQMKKEIFKNDMESIHKVKFLPQN